MSNKIIEHIYVHVPFCLKKCNYCSFYSTSCSENNVGSFYRGLIKEIDLYRGKYLLKPKTVYFGGGTPSLLKVSYLSEILGKFDLSQCKEITLEANPLNISTQYAKRIREAGINRISLGAQSFLDSELELLGRLHRSDQIKSAYEILVNQEFENISLDFIYGLPFQQKKDVIYSIRQLTALAPEHASFYCLDLAKEVSLYTLRKDIPSDEDVSGFYYQIRHDMLAAGYEHYELSNFSRPGFESQHNLAYWHGNLYLGFGPAAVGFNGQIRYQNPKDLEQYLVGVEAGTIEPDEEQLTPESAVKEFIFLNLRTANGLDLDKYRNKFGSDFETDYQSILHRHYQNKLLIKKDGAVKLTPEAYFIADEVLADFC